MRRNAWGLNEITHQRSANLAHALDYDCAALDRTGSACRSALVRAGRAAVAERALALLQATRRARRRSVANRGRGHDVKRA